MVLTLAATHAPFEQRSDEVAHRFGYQVKRASMGPDDPEVGPPTVMAVLDRRRTR